MSKEKSEVENIRTQPEVGALWKKDQFDNLKFFCRIDVKEMELLIKKAKRNSSEKINLVGYTCKKSNESGKNGPDFILVESKFNNDKKIRLNDE